jgi:hypothetical protein
MSQPTPHVEDLLLDYAYGELPETHRREVASHLGGCPECALALEEIQGVRQVMSHLPEHSAPDAGLQSLLAYAESAARRTSAGPQLKQPWWRGWMAPVGGVLAVAIIFVAGQQVAQERAEPDFVARQAVGGGLEAMASGPAALASEQAVVAEPARAEPLPVPDQTVAPSRQKQKSVTGARPSMAPVGRGAVARDDQQATKKEAPERSFGNFGGLYDDFDARPAREAEQGPAPAPAPAAKRAAPMAEPSPAQAETAAAPAPRGVTFESDSVAGEFKGAERTRKEEARSQAAEATARAEALSKQAWAAYGEGDRAQEASLLRQALATGVHGAPLVPGLLNRLCDAEYALGNVSAAQAACRRVLAEYPGPAAQVAQRRMKQAQPAGESGAAPKPASAADVD